MRDVALRRGEGVRLEIIGHDALVPVDLQEAALRVLDVVEMDGDDFATAVARHGRR